MAAVYVNIKPEIIQWALSQVQEERLGEKLMQHITEWLDGTKRPTFHQIEELSKKTNIPLGYFFLETPPEEQIAILAYRTIDSAQLANPSRDLRDTIYEMECVQEWMQSYRQDFDFNKVSIVNCLHGVTEPQIIVDRMREDLELNLNWYEEGNSSRENFNYIREKLETCGVLVMKNGVVAQNTHRALDSNEFRAFAMVDEWAPLIFINGADSNGAKLFSLLHEAVHIWLGQNDFFNDRRNQDTAVSVVEQLCNAVTGELMVPSPIFLEKWGTFDTEDTEKISRLAKQFRCSEVVIARKAIDNHKIEKDTYDSIVRQAIEQSDQRKENRGQKGGDFYNNLNSNMDRNFVRALCESIGMGRTTYTEAYRLTSTTGKTFSQMAQRMGCAGW